MELIQKNLKGKWICYLLSGEQISASLMAMAFESLKIPAISLNAFQVKIHTDNNYGDAKILNIETERINKELEKGKIVIVTGFQGIDDENNYTTLGRGGSDTTAVALAAALKADLCEIFTDVDGVFAADPNVVKKAIKIDNISYDEMLEFSNLGAGVLHNKCVKMAKEKNVKLVVKSSLSNKSGTIVSDLYKKYDIPKVTGVTSNDNIVSIVGSNMDADTKDKVINMLNADNFDFQNIKQTDRSISVTVDKENVNQCVNCMYNLFF